MSDIQKLLATILIVVLAFAASYAGAHETSQRPICEMRQTNALLEFEVIDNQLGSDKIVEIAEELFRRYGQVKGL